MKPSQLKKLAKVCREAGIKHFKNADFEFTLTDEVPEIKELNVKPLTRAEMDKEIESDELGSEAMLFWSTQDSVGNEDKVN